MTYDENLVPVAFADNTVLEVMSTARAMRWYTDEPVSEELIRTLVWAGTRAPSPGNSQGWDFLVVTDPAKRLAIRDAIRPLLEKIRASGRESAQPALRAGSLNLMENMHEVPVLMFVCGRTVYPPAEPREDMMYSAVYGACQNILLAARSLGLGAAMTTFHSAFEETIRPLLGVPDDVHMGAMLPIGWPARSFGPVKRLPVDEVAHRDHWDNRGVADGAARR